MVEYRLVGPREGASLAASLAGLHLDAHASGMALGLLAPKEHGPLEAAYRERVARVGDALALVVAEDDGAVLGMGWLERAAAENAPHRAEIQRLAVAANARGSGIGRGLTAALEDVARDRGITLLWLTTHDGTDAVRFYESVGYTRMGVMPRYSRTPEGALADNVFFYKLI